MVVPFFGKIATEGRYVRRKGHFRLQEHFLDLIDILLDRLNAACKPELKREIDVHPGTEYPE